jgi:hypothetical protein
MPVQTSYGAPNAGAPGLIYDVTPHVINSRTNTAEDGAVKFGYGVVRGENPGKDATAADAAATAQTFEGVVVQGGSVERTFVTNEAKIYHGTTLSLLEKGRVWVALKDSEEPVYGAQAFLQTAGNDAGKFATTGGVALNARFIGAAQDGTAPVEFFGEPVAATPVTEP